jgi:hypothetical protein
MLTHVPDHDFRPVELHLDGHGILYTVIRAADGSQSSVPPAVLQARTPLA